MLDRLRRGEEAGIESGRAPELLHHFLAFLDDTHDRLASFVVCDEDGIPVFDRLRFGRQPQTEAVLFAFDVLESRERNAYHHQ